MTSKTYFKNMNFTPSISYMTVKIEERSLTSLYSQRVNSPFFTSGLLPVVYSAYSAIFESTVWMGVHYSIYLSKLIVNCSQRIPTLQYHLDNVD